jgi:hypothetical protein
VAKVIATVPGTGYLAAMGTLNPDAGGMWSFETEAARQRRLA